MLCGRQLFGSAPSKGQELEEHYFGTIRPIVSGFMSWTRSCGSWAGSAETNPEVAPCQHELAPIYDITNVAIDPGLLTMEMMKKIADKHGLVCLHEKPFSEDVNGSSKHNNWSISTKRRACWIGDTPMENLQFMVFLYPQVIEALTDAAGLRTIVALTAITVWAPSRGPRPSFPSSSVGAGGRYPDAICTDSPYAGRQDEDGPGR